MSVRFPTLALAVAYTGYKANEDVWVGGGSVLGDEVSGYYVFRRGADTPAGPGVIVVPNGRLERTSDPNAQYDALAVRTAARLKPELDDLDTKIGAMELTLSNALLDLPARVAEQLRNSELGRLPVAFEPGSITGGGSAPEFGADTAGAIANGGAAQQVIAAVGAARYVFLSNDSDGDLRVIFGSGEPSAASGRRISPGGSIVNRTAERVSIWGMTTGQPFTFAVSAP